MDFFVGTLAGGLTLGAIYSLVAVAFSLYCSTGGGFSFAPGGIWLTATLVAAAAGSVFLPMGPAFAPLALCASLLAAIAFGGAAAWIACRSSVGGTRAGVWPLIASAGVLLAAVGLLQLMRQLHVVFRMPAAPPLVVIVANVFSVQIAAGQPVIMALAAAVFGGLAYLSRKTGFGRLRHAVAQDREIAELLGVNSDRIGFFSTLTACLVAAGAGWMFAVAQALPAPENAFLNLVYVLLALTLGGAGSPKRSAAAGFMVGVGQTFWSAYLGQPYAVLALFAAVVFLARYSPQRSPLRGPVEEI